MKLLVIGASRGIGLEVVKQALSRGHGVRAFARSADAIGLSNSRLEKRNGSALQVSDVASALAGVDAVILTLGVRAGPGMVLGPVDLFSRATQIVIDAMKKARVKRLICVTGLAPETAVQSSVRFRRCSFNFCSAAPMRTRMSRKLWCARAASIGLSFGPSSSQAGLRLAVTRCSTTRRIGEAARSPAPTLPIFSSNSCKLPLILERHLF